MAVYDTVTKIIVGTPMTVDTTNGMILGTQDSGTAGTLAKTINDYWKSLDETTETVQNVTAVSLDATTIAVIITSDVA
tara:strand:+ start:607 stop:840 length:234 start_codon:yes stop_codon:yes gene_type:complete